MCQRDEELSFKWGTICTPLQMLTEAGMRVEYDNWGEVDRIFALENNEYKETEQIFAKISEGITNCSLISTYALAQGCRKAVGTYTYSY